ncbi:MAG: glycosyltransferase family 4 protein [Oscillospiraceae bacterium]|nr:glycosyltransferase family 4 protein [Oscillospiraceae bacterium]
MKKVAIVVQRYGVEVNGGSETYARMLAEHLVSHFEVEVLTTCALDYVTWANHFPEGTSEINGVMLRRFEVDKERDMQKFIDINDDKKKNIGTATDYEWNDEQGPYCPKLIEYIKKKKDDYCTFIFVTYLYYLTVRGMELVSDKAILIPTAHDEPYLYFEIYKDIFAKPKAIVFLTDEEKELVHNVFENEYILSDVIGVGVEVPESGSFEVDKIPEGHENYLVYVGRIDLEKNCPELFSYFIEYKRRNPSSLKLYMIGSVKTPIPEHSDIISLGFVSDSDKFYYMERAKLLVLPSQYESLSFSVLESMTLGVPVIVNEKSEVLKGHCKKSNAGLYYASYEEFEGCINYLLVHDDVYDEMSLNAKEYIRTNYRWDVVVEKYKKIIESI